ncbi:I78 family peptidase inhibitor [Pelagovum sp. HNIBRBA483]|uniref:I78 family peptidase inhibitor n=1 Tax=Pelagovum sp. HNIBRBA483 TaxID=3233341 RepID=UPI0034A42625
MRRSLQIVSSICILIMLAACQTMAVLPALPSAEQDTCNAAQHSSLIGAHATDLERTLILQPVRVIRPDSLVTMDFLPTRLNFHINGQNVIARISCG